MDLQNTVEREIFEALIFRGLASKSHFVAQCSWNDCSPEATPLNICMIAGNSN